MMLAVKIPQLPTNNMCHSEATNCLCITFSESGLKAQVAL